MSAGFTPGPWVIKRDDEFFGSPRVLYSSDGEPLMGDATYYPWVPSDDADWNLIAAAPELLDALQEALEYIPARARPALLAKARAAINKATQGATE